MAEYTEPELRERLKQEIQASDRGGRKGQWSARKSQLLVQEYEKAGGGYRGERDERQKSLERWGEQDWQTSAGDATARGASGTERYLPKDAWSLLTPKERDATDVRKEQAEKQFVENTDAAREARAAIELISLSAAEAGKRIRRADSAGLLRRVRKAEQRVGDGRKTVLDAVERRLEKLSR